MSVASYTVRSGRNGVDGAAAPPNGGADARSKVALPLWTLRDFASLSTNDPSKSAMSKSASRIWTAKIDFLYSPATMTDFDSFAIGGRGAKRTLQIRANELVMNCIVMRE